MMQFFGQLMKLPLEAFVYSMEMLVQTMRGIQHLAYQGMDMMADRNVQASADVSSSKSTIPEVTYDVPEVTHAVSEGISRGRTEAMQVTIAEEERRMSDKDLRDEKVLKLVRYKILFVKRDYEYPFPEQEELVAENMDEASYTAWKIAQFIQNLKETPIPKKWEDKNYPPVKLESPPASRTPGMINELPEDDKKYLRVYYEVLQRFPREEFKYEQRQIEVLEEIRDRMPR
jgi:hypothetical protein